MNRARSQYCSIKLQRFTSDNEQQPESSSAGDHKTTAEQNKEITNAARNFKVTLNDDDANLLENLEIMSASDGTANGNGAGSLVSGDTRRLSVPPSLTTNQDAVDLVDMVDDLLKDLTVTFSAVCKEVFEKLDDMAARIDAMEARALAAASSEGAEEAAGTNAESK